MTYLMDLKLAELRKNWDITALTVYYYCHCHHDAHHLLNSRVNICSSANCFWPQKQKKKCLSLKKKKKKCYRSTSPSCLANNISPTWTKMFQRIKKAEPWNNNVYQRLIGMVLKVLKNNVLNIYTFMYISLVFWTFLMLINNDLLCDVS